MSKKVKQRDITDCGAACLTSIAAHYNLKLPLSRIRQMAGTDQKGTNVLGLIKAAEKMGFEAKGVKGGSDALSKIPLPAIAHVVVQERLHHYIVVCQVKNNIITVMDPADGQYHKHSLDGFSKIWTNILVLMAPGDQFATSNEKISNFKRFMFLLRPHRGILFQALFGAIVYTILGLSTSVYIQKITDFVLSTATGTFSTF
jgi:ATP-binding cassette subfamily B protein